MPYGGEPEAILILLRYAVAVGCAFWCRTVLLRKGRSSVLGLALGFVLTSLFFLYGAGVALLISYAVPRVKVTPERQRRITRRLMTREDREDWELGLRARQQMDQSEEPGEEGASKEPPQSRTNPETGNGGASDPLKPP